jgi:hypothetical protein
VKRLVLIALAVLASTGVAAKKEKPKPWVAEAPNYVLAAPPADQAQIVFVEPINKIQGMFPICILDVTGDQQKLLAMSWWKGKTVALLPAGKHLLYAPSHIMEANVEAGKRYYVLLRFIYAQGFQLRPIRTSGTSPYRTTSPDFQKWLKETRWVEKTPEADLVCGESTADAATAAATANGVQNAQNNWQAKTAAEAAELTLNPEDAVAE